MTHLVLIAIRRFIQGIRKKAETYTYENDQRTIHEQSLIAYPPPTTFGVVVGYAYPAVSIS
jgi:hypothetical protein